MKELGFMESKNTHLILFSAVFLVLGFLLGRVTGHQGPRMHKGHPGCMEVGDNLWVSDGEVEVMMFTDEEFEGDSVEETEPELPPEPVVEPEEEVIDIDDSTASGRLSALRREMDSDSDGQLSKSREDLAKRMDSFLKDR